MAVAVADIIIMSFVNMSPERNNLTFFNIQASSASVIAGVTMLKYTTKTTLKEKITIIKTNLKHTMPVRR